MNATTQTKEDNSTTGFVKGGNSLQLQQDFTVDLGVPEAGAL
jgi:hypothetical protein